MAPKSARMIAIFAVAAVAIVGGFVYWHSFDGLQTVASVTLSFVRYTNAGAAVLEITNREYGLLRCSGLNVAIADVDVAKPEAEHWPFEPNGFILVSGGGKLLLVRPIGPATALTPLRPPELPTTISVVCTRLTPPSKLRRQVDTILKKVGIGIKDKSFVTSADSPVK